MNFKNRTQIELENSVLNFLISSNSYKTADIQTIIRSINSDSWNKDNKQILNYIKNFYSQEREGSVFNWLILKCKSKAKLTSILDDVVPLPLVKQIIQDLNIRQEETKYKTEIKKLLNKPIKEIRESLNNLINSPSEIYKPQTLLETGQKRIIERKLEANAPSTGYKHLDTFLKGFICGHTYVLSGNTNSGKSTMCLNFAHRISQQGKKTLYFALEPENTIVDYLASIKLKKRFSELTNEDILLNDPNIDVFSKEQIRTIDDMVKAIHVLPRYDLIIIDHIGYFTSGANNLVTKQSDAMKKLAGLAKSKLTAVMLVQHMNKSKQNKNSPENNITGSAAFKQDATDVLILKRNTEEDIYGATKFLSTGAILIRKAKSEKPQGIVPIKFINGSALILEDNEYATQQAIKF